MHVGLTRPTNFVGADPALLRSPTLCGKPETGWKKKYFSSSFGNFVSQATKLDLKSCLKMVFSHLLPSRRVGTDADKIRFSALATHCRR
jgi:hypothetical protein